MGAEPYVQVRSSGHTIRSTRVNAPRSQPVRRVARGVPAGVVDDAELGRGRPGAGELAVVGVALAGGVAHPAHAAVAGVEDPLLDVLPRRARRRVQVEPAAPADLVEREREPHVLEPVRASAVA